MTQAYPLQWPSGWPRTRSGGRQRARFGKRSNGRWGTGQLTVADARQRLFSEVHAFTRAGHPSRIDPDLVVISSDVPTRQDGLPRSGAKEPDDPGVAIYFHMDGEPYCFPCDAWDRVADNIAAVAAHLGAMRGIGRWGVGDLRQAFTGWKALPNPELAGGRNWREVLGVDPDAPPDEIKQTYMRLRRITHPDHGGDAEVFHAVQRAWEQAQQEIGNG